MGLLVKPYLGCNIQCKYCYEGPLRNVKKPKLDYDLDAVVNTIRRLKDEVPSIGLHGGEIFCIPNKDLEVLLKETYRYGDSVSIQTNATLLDDKKIKLLKKYNASLGISWDGPDELSSARPGTEKVGEIIDKVMSRGINVGMIIVVSEANAGTKVKREKLKKWIYKLNKEKGIGARLNPCYKHKDLELKPSKRVEIYLDLAKFCLENDIRWSPFTDIIRALQNKKNKVCTFDSCDMFCTKSATSVMGDGSVTNCMRTNEKFILLRDKKEHNTRLEILRETPMKYGGCRGCKYIEMCTGGCPTATINNDWRNRTSWCDVWYSLFQYFENVLKLTENENLYSRKEKDNTVKKERIENSHMNKKKNNGHGDHFVHSNKIMV
jgi:uncharacterized protein